MTADDARVTSDDARVTADDAPDGRPKTTPTPPMMAPITATPTLPDVVCPYLGLVDDPATHLVFPSHAQRCHATSRPSSIETAKQARDCLTADHVRCSLYRPYASPVPHGAVRAAISAEAQARAQPARNRPPAGRVARVVPFAILIVGLAIGGILIGSWMASLVGGTPTESGASSGPGVSGTPAPAAAISPAPSAPPTTPTPMPTPSTSSMPSASPATTPSPTPSPAPDPTPIVHRVRPGDTLTSIAARYGVTIAAIRKANGIEDPNLIIVGQRLVIPAP